MPNQAASLIGVPVTTLAHWQHQHRGSPYVGFGRVVRYRLAAIDAWILAQEIERGEGLPDPIEEGGKPDPSDDSGKQPDLTGDTVDISEFQPNAGGT